MMGRQKNASENLFTMYKYTAAQNLNFFELKSKT
jgi:hypothetical protein